MAKKIKSLEGYEEMLAKIANYQEQLAQAENSTQATSLHAEIAGLKQQCADLYGSVAVDEEAAEDEEDNDEGEE